jgi:hypothetical protein
VVTLSGCAPTPLESDIRLARDAEELASPLTRDEIEEHLSTEP